MWINQKKTTIWFGWIAWIKHKYPTINYRLMNRCLPNENLANKISVWFLIIKFNVHYFMWTGAFPTRSVATYSLPDPKSKSTNLPGRRTLRPSLDTKCGGVLGTIGSFDGDDSGNNASVERPSISWLTQNKCRLKSIDGYWLNLAININLNLLFISFNHFKRTLKSQLQWRMYCIIAYKHLFTLWQMTMDKNFFRTMLTCWHWPNRSHCTKELFIKFKTIFIIVKLKKITW